MKEKFNVKYGVLERNFEPSDNQIPSHVVVHDGVPHADDIMAVWLCQQLNPNVDFIRTRNEDILRFGLQDPKTIVCDVGEGLLDHHDINQARYYPGDKNVSQMAACGLVWEEWGAEIVKTWMNQNKFMLHPGDTIERVSNQFRDYVLRPIEVKDTTAGRGSVPRSLLLINSNGRFPVGDQQSTVSDFVRSNATVWLPLKQIEKDEENFTNNLEKLNYVSEEYYKKHAQFETNLYPTTAMFTNQNPELLKEIEQNHVSQNKDQLVLDNYIKEELKLLDPSVEVFSFDNEYTNVNTFKNTNIKLLLCPNASRTEIQVRTIDDAIHLNKEMVSNIPAPKPFVHPMGHMCAIRTGNERSINDCFDIAKHLSQDVITYYRDITYEADRGNTIEMDTNNIEAAIYENSFDFSR